MRHIVRQLFTMFAGAAVLGVTLVAAGAFAQEGDTASGAQPVMVQGTMATQHSFQYQGQLFNPNGGQPRANETVNLVFRLYEQPSSGSPFWSEDKNVTTNVDGLFTSRVGSAKALDLNRFDGRELYLGVAINGEEGGPRLPISYVPYAFWAREADSLDGLGSGDLVRTVAYGIVDENGGRVKGSGFNSSVAGDNVYEISINGENYNLNDFVTVVTPITQSACPKPTIAGTNSDNTSGKLLVELFNRDGGRVRCKFHFIVAKP